MTAIATPIPDEVQDAFRFVIVRNDVEWETVDVSTTCPPLTKLAATLTDDHFFIEHADRFFGGHDGFYEKPLVTLVVKRSDDLYVAVTYQQNERWACKHTKVWLGVPAKVYSTGSLHTATPVISYTAGSAKWALGHDIDQVREQTEKHWLKALRKDLKEQMDTSRAQIVSIEENLTRQRERLAELEGVFRSYGWRVTK